MGISKFLSTLNLLITRHTARAIFFSSLSLPSRTRFFIPDRSLCGWPQEDPLVSAPGPPIVTHHQTTIGMIMIPNFRHIPKIAHQPVFVLIDVPAEPLGNDPGHRVYGWR